MTKTAFKALFKPLVIAAFMAWFCRPLYMHGTQCDVFMMLLLIGMPFGIGRMMIWFFPRGLGIGGSVAVFAFNVLIGGMIGIFVFAFQMLVGITLLFKNVTTVLYKIFRR